MIESIALSFLSALTHVPTLIMRIQPFRKRITGQQKRRLLVCYGTCLMLDFLFCFFLCRTERMTIGAYKSNLLLFSIVVGAVNILVIPGFWREHMFTFGVTALIVSICLTIGAYVVGRIGFQDVPRGLIWVSIIGNTIYACLHPWTRRLIRHTVTPFLELKSEAYWKNIWFAPIAIFFSSMMVHGYQEYSDSLLDVVRLVLVGVVTYLLCVSVAQSYRMLLEKNWMTRQIRLQKQYYSALTETMEKDRQARHNFKHHLAAIRSFLDTGDTSALRAYCDELEIDLADVEIPYTGNSAADGVLYYYAGQAKKQGIAYRVRCTLAGLWISDTDLCCLLGNALDNALTGCENVSGRREITVAAEKSEDMLLLTVDNTFDGVLRQENGRILSRKREHSPGIGISTMEEICGKYQGSCRFQAKDNRFEASFLLKLRQ